MGVGRLREAAQGRPAPDPTTDELCRVPVMAESGQDGRQDIHTLTLLHTRLTPVPLNLWPEPG